MPELLPVIAAILFLAIGISSFFRAFLLVREVFPVVFKEGLSTSYLVDSYVWNPLVPSRTRRFYLLYLGSVATAEACFSALFLLKHEFGRGFAFRTPAQRQCCCIYCNLHDGDRW